MYRFIGEQTAYSYFNSLSVVIALVGCLLFYFSKRHSISLYSEYAINGASKLHKYLGIPVKIILVSLESLIVTAILTLSTNVNAPFGNLVGTGASYFGALALFGAVVFLVAIVICSNPLKEVDFVTLIAPLMLSVVKFACFMNGCCWGIEWKHGFYNSHPDHPGYQVPVQAIESFWCVAIFTFFLWYKKKAKPGAMYPMYLILYSATRFCSEFFRREENVWGPFKTNHILCMIYFAVGIVLFLIINKYGEKISDFFDRPHVKFADKIAEENERIARELAEENAKHEAERLEKVRLAREKARARKK